MKNLKIKLKKLYYYIVPYTIICFINNIFDITYWYTKYYYRTLGEYKPEWAISKHWRPIVKRAISKIEKINKDLPESEWYKAVQIKEKFSGLRLYTNFTSDEVDEIIDQAELEAEETCEKCGSHEEVKESGERWITRLCKKCRNKNG